MQESIESRKLRTRFGTYLSKVEEGASFFVTRNGQPVAELRPIPQVEQAEQEAHAQEQKADKADAVMPEPTAISALGLACYQSQLAQPVPVQAAAEVAVDAVPVELDTPAEMNGTAMHTAKPMQEDKPAVSAAAPATEKSKPKTVQKAARRSAGKSARKKPASRRTTARKKK